MFGRSRYKVPGRQPAGRQEGISRVPHLPVLLHPVVARRVAQQRVSGARSALCDY